MLIIKKVKLYKILIKRELKYIDVAKRKKKKIYIYIYIYMKFYNFLILQNEKIKK